MEDKKIYPCDYPGCKVMRTEAEGGKIFTVCDKHWTAIYPKRNSKLCRKPSVSRKAESLLIG